MAVRTWLGRAGGQAQVNTFTYANTWAADDTSTITINTKTVTFTSISSSIEDQVDGLLALLQASSFGEFSQITWSKSGTTIIVATGASDGTPFTATASESTAGSGTLTAAAVTTPTGPNWVDNADNWEGGAAPGAGDDAHIENSAVSLKYGLDQLSGTLTSLRVANSFTGDIGLPKTAVGGYPEYLPDFLDVNVTTVTIGSGEGSGSSRVKLNFGSVQTTVEVRSTGSAVEDGVPAVLLNGTHASNVLDIQQGSVGWAFFGGEDGDLATVRMVTGELQLGAAMTTLGTVQIQGGVAHIRFDVTTLTQTGGITYVYGATTVGTLSLLAGQCIYLSSGTITTLNLGGRTQQARADFSADRSGRTVTNFNLSENGVVVDPARTVTYTNGIVVTANVTQVNAV